MKTFLNHVASSLIQQFGNNLSDIVVVFPNKRASLFMNEHLVSYSEKPIWAPQYTTISELFRSLSSREVGDHIRLVCQLYPIYLKLTQKTETDEPLDKFYGWGEILLSDFDDVDKNMVDSQVLFQNLRDLRNLDSDPDSFLDEEQKEALSQFFGKFQFDRTELQKTFTTLWNILGELYTQYNENLRKENILYEGALYREVANNLNASLFTAKKYVFVGFNVLNKVEEMLFQKVQEFGKALFYWDYDEYYHHNEAGLFLTRNILRFGNELKEKEAFQHMSNPKQVEYISASTENAQVRHITPWLEQNLTEQENETAVVLCNESLLEPVLHSLPSKVQNLNITMGFPLSDTPIFSFVQALCSLYLEGFNEAKSCYRLQPVYHLLQHPYSRILSSQSNELAEGLMKNHRFFPESKELQKDEALTLLFPSFIHTKEPELLLKYIQQQLEALATRWQQQEELADENFTPLYQEALYKTSALITRLSNLMQQHILTVRTRTLVRFIYQLMSGMSIPFHGEPAIGLQVMGVLETRNLDFKHLIMLSVNEGMLPKSVSEASFVPYNLRRAFGMTLIEQKIAVYAYYFYRLIQRAEKVTLLYNSNTEGLQKGEMSRFMQQYLVEHPQNHQFVIKTLQSNQHIEPPRKISVDKTPEIVQQMLQNNQRSYLSPSALKTYLDCTLQYYFQYVAKIKPADKVTDEIDNALFGTLFHRCAELVYMELGARRKGDIWAEDIKGVQKNKMHLMEIVSFSMKENLFNLAADRKDKDSPEYIAFLYKAPLPTLNGIQQLIHHVLLQYLTELLKNDLKNVPFRILGLEMPIKDTFPIEINGKKHLINIGGNIDRKDEYTNAEGVRSVRIIDYKTSSSIQKTESIAKLFEHNAKRAYQIFQAMFYAIQVKDTLPVTPALYYIQKAAGKDYTPQIELGSKNQKVVITDFEKQCGDEYRSLLKTLLEEVYNADVPFTQAEDTHACEWCDFKKICNR